MTHPDLPFMLMLCDIQYPPDTVAVGDEVGACPLHITVKLQTHISSSSAPAFGYTLQNKSTKAGILYTYLGVRTR